MNLEPDDVSERTCNSCNYTFSFKKSLYRHQRKFHPSTSCDVGGKQVCIICGRKFRAFVEFQKHYEIHGIILNFVKKSLYCEVDFKAWKKEIEFQSQCLFVPRGAPTKLADGRMSTYFVCHRTRRKFKRPRKPPKWSDYYRSFNSCPAYIKKYEMTIHEATEIEIEFQSVHVGHNLNLTSLVDILKVNSNNTIGNDEASEALVDEGNPHGEKSEKEQDVMTIHDVPEIKYEFQPVRVGHNLDLTNLIGILKVNSSNTHCNTRVSEALINDVNSLDENYDKSVNREQDEDSRKLSLCSKLKEIQSLVMKNMTPEQFKIVEDGLNSIKTQYILFPRK